MIRNDTHFPTLALAATLLLLSMLPFTGCHRAVNKSPGTEAVSMINAASDAKDYDRIQFLGLLDLETGHLSYCNAGHNPPILGGGDQGGAFVQMLPNAPIGVLPGLEYQGEEIESIKGRPLFVYTDGLNEAENPAHEQYGDERLLDFLRNSSFESARKVIEGISADVQKHRNGAEPNDDLTMMCLNVKIA